MSNCSDYFYNGDRWECRGCGIKIDFGCVLCCYQNALGWDNKRMSAELGVHRTTVSRWTTYRVTPNVEKQLDVICEMKKNFKRKNK